MISKPTPTSSWTAANVDLKQQSATGPAIAVAPFPCAWQLVSSGKLGRNSQYVLWSNLGPNNHPNPILDLVVEIQIDEALVVSPTLGVPPGSPIGFQINSLPAGADKLAGQTTTGWTPTAGDLAIGWQQYGVKMWPKTTRRISWSQYWPPSVVTNPNVPAFFTANIPNDRAVTLPNDLTVLAGPYASPSPTPTRAPAPSRDSTAG